MRDTELYERLLGLKEPWRVKAVKMDVQGRRIEVEVECAEGTIWACAESRQRVHIHGWERRSWRHLDTRGFSTVITADPAARRTGSRTRGDRQISLIDRKCTTCDRIKVYHLGRVVF